MKVYFDNAASTKVRDEVVELMTYVMSEEYGNPSSTHSAGRSALKILEQARNSVVEALGADGKDHVYFTSGGTESNNWAIFGAAEAAHRIGKHIITSDVEHSAVLEPIKKLQRNGYEVSYLKTDKNGKLCISEFERVLRDDTMLVSLMLVNNETGCANDIGAFSKVIKRRKLRTLLHTDAVQGLCKVNFDVKRLGVDLLSISAHKLHGPKGAGALYIKNDVKIAPIMLGGANEDGQRAGTVALASVAGFGEAVRLAMAEFDQVTARVRGLRERAIGLLHEELPEAVVIGAGDSPFLLSLSLPGFKSEVLMNCLEAEGISVSKSSACKKGARSRVLSAMGINDKVIDGALRVSFSRYSTAAEVDYFVKSLHKASKGLIKM